MKQRLSSTKSKIDEEHEKEWRSYIMSVHMARTITEQWDDLEDNFQQRKLLMSKINRIKRQLDITGYAVEEENKLEERRKMVK